MYQPIKTIFPLKICPAPGNVLLLQLARTTEISICGSLIKSVTTWKTKSCYQLVCHLKNKTKKKVSESSLVWQHHSRGQGPINPIIWTTFILLVRIQVHWWLSSKTWKSSKLCINTFISFYWKTDFFHISH